MSFGGNDIAAIAKLLDTDEHHSDSDEDDKPKTEFSKMTPGSIGLPKAKEPTTVTVNVKEAPEIISKANSKDIWTEDEVMEGAQYDDLYDPRPQPEFEIVYKQDISSEDMFLQMQNKTALTSSCRAMVVKITLPNTNVTDVKLDVKDKFLDCRSPKYKLGLHLPHPVDSQSSRATWDSKTSILAVTLHITREYDFVNF